MPRLLSYNARAFGLLLPARSRKTTVFVGPVDQYMRKPKTIFALCKKASRAPKTKFLGLFCVKAVEKVGTSSGITLGTTC